MNHDFLFLTFRSESSALPRPICMDGHRRKPLMRWLAWILLATSISASDAFAQPSREDPAVDHSSEINLAITPSPEPKQTGLIVFIPGTSTIRQNPQNFSLEQTLARGVRVVVLTTADASGNRQLCPDDVGNCRLPGERVVVPAPSWATPEANLQERIKAVLHQLVAIHPREGWDFYLEPDGNPNWLRIMVLGRRRNPG